MKKGFMKKGFTLVELLAVIVILGVVSMVTYGIVTNNIKTTKQKSFEISSQNLLESSKEYVTKYMDNNDFPEGGIEVTSEELEIKNNPFISGIVKKDDNGQIVLENVTDGNYCANGTKNNMEIKEGTCETQDETEPELKVKQLKVGTTTAQIMVKTQDSGSGIKSYKVCKEQDCTTYEKEGTKTLVKEVVKLEGLNPNTEYKITITSTNGVGQSIISENLTIKTLEVEAPEFRISTKTHATNKMLEIIYPINDGNYEYFYNTVVEDKDTKEKITTEYTTEETKVELKIETAMEVEAYIKKGVDIVAENSITIGGIDLDGPIVNLVVPKPNEWSQSKILGIESQDNAGGVGLALRPYSFDGGKNWVKSNTQEFKTSISKLDIRSRDRLGNNNKTFTENGVKCDTGEEAQTICSLKTIDSIAPKIEIKVKEGTTVTNNTEWYNSKKVVLEVTLTDYYLLDDVKTQGGSGIKEDTLKVEVSKDKGTPKTLEAKKISTNVYEFEITESGENEVIVTVLDNVGNKGKTTKIVKIDNVVPVITAKSNPLSLGNADYQFVNNINVTYGPLGGTATCSPESSRRTGSYTVTCTATGNNTLVANNNPAFTFTARHSYGATRVSRTCTNRVCEEYSCQICTSQGECCSWSWDGGCNGDMSSCTPDQQCTGGYGCCSSWKSTTCCNYRNVNYDCSYYTCPNGGSLNGTTCYY